jgi:ABC-type uncharacterized transport system substrate-binding protein
MKRVAIFLTGPAADLEQDYIQPFKNAMAALPNQWVEGRNIRYYIIDSPTPIRDEKARASLAERVVLQRPPPDAIWLISTESALAVLKVSTERGITIPTVGSAVSSEIGATTPDHFAAIYSDGWKLGRERYRALKQLKPDTRRVGVLVKPDHVTSAKEFDLIDAEVRADGGTATRADVFDDNDLDSAFTTFKAAEVQAVLTTHVPLFQTSRKEIIARATAQGIPVVGHRRVFLQDGALLERSTNLADQMAESAKMLDDMLNKKKVNTAPTLDKSFLAISGAAATTFAASVSEELEKEAEII